MATTDSVALAPMAGAEVAGLATLWPKSSTAISLQLVEPMHVLSLRHLPGGGASALSTVMAGHKLPVLPGAGPLLRHRASADLAQPQRDLAADARRRSGIGASRRAAAGARRLGLRARSLGWHSGGEAAGWQRGGTAVAPGRCARAAARNRPGFARTTRGHRRGGLARCAESRWPSCRSCERSLPGPVDELRS